MPVIIFTKKRVRGGGQTEKWLPDICEYMYFDDRIGIGNHVHGPGAVTGQGKNGQGGKVRQKFLHFYSWTP